jgi:hypothetical protein
VTLATAQTTTVPWGYRAYCREHRLDLRGFTVKARAQEAADDHNRHAHADELQASIDVAGLAWLLAGSRGRVPAGAFPHWAMPGCEHPAARQHGSGAARLCMDCARPVG